MKKIICIMMMGLGLAACQTTVKSKNPDVTIKGDGYEIEMKDSNSGTFCPPGQAKKGNC